MESVHILDVVSDVALGDIVNNFALDAEVRATAGEMLMSGYQTADLMAVAKNDEDAVSLVMVPNRLDENPVWKRVTDTVFGSDGLSVDAEARLISRNIAKGFAALAHPFTKSENTFGESHACLICGSTVEQEVCEPLTKVVGFPFTLNTSPVDVPEDDSDLDDDSTTDGAVQVELDPATVAAILSAVQENVEPEDSSSLDYGSDDESSSSSYSEMAPTVGEDWKDGLDPWQSEIAENLDEIVENLGRIPAPDAGYTDISPFAEQGATCANCVACGENGSCDWVATMCNPDGWCKFNIVPVRVELASQAENYYKSLFHRRNKKQDDETSGEDDSWEGDDDDENIEMSAGVRKDGPTVEGVHVDAVGSFVASKRKKPKFVPENMTVIEQVNPEVMQDANLMQKAEIPGALQKSDEQRYTLGPWYVPNRADAHGEWTDPQELQKALWGYVENGDRDIRLQHNVNIVAGKWVEALTWPHPIEVPMVQADTGQISKTTFPAGTVFLGVVWEPWAWELVKKGEIRGYSIGGTGSGVEVDLPTEESTYDTFTAYKR